MLGGRFGKSSLARGSPDQGGFQLMSLLRGGVDL